MVEKNRFEHLFYGEFCTCILKLMFSECQMANHGIIIFVIKLHAIRIFIIIYVLIYLF